MNEFRAAPPTPAESPLHRVTAVVKWFNRAKGFGFLAATDGSGDIFLGASVLSQTGHAEIGEGVSLVCDVAPGPKGPSVATIIEIDGARAAEGRRPPPADRLNPAQSGPAERLAGSVKWFDITRGFGFIAAADGGDDIFVHLSALRRSGLDMLTAGQAVRMLVQKSRRGREAATVELT